MTTGPTLRRVRRILQDKVEAFRTQHNLTWKEFAQFTNLSERQARELFSLKARRTKSWNPAVETLCSVADRMGSTLEDFLTPRQIKLHDMQTWVDAQSRDLQPKLDSAIAPGDMTYIWTSVHKDKTLPRTVQQVLAFIEDPNDHLSALKMFDVPAAIAVRKGKEKDIFVWTVRTSHYPGDITFEVSLENERIESFYVVTFATRDSLQRLGPVRAVRGRWTIVAVASQVVRVDFGALVGVIASPNQIKTIEEDKAIFERIVELIMDFLSKPTYKDSISQLP